MKVLLATPEQFAALNGYQNGASELRFVTDGLGRPIIGKQCLTDPAFAAIWPQLADLEEVDYVPPAPEEEA